VREGAGVSPGAMKLLASSTFRRVPAAVPTARAFVSRTLVPLALSVEASDRLVLAAAEAFNNVVLHASGESFAVTVAVERGTCMVSVADTGHGFRVPAARPGDAVTFRDMGGKVWRGTRSA